MAKRAAPDLTGKKDLILHTYDSFLVAQTRLFVQASAMKDSDNSEIDRRRELLLLDDLMAFSIAARRLVELTGLKSFANRCMIHFMGLDRSEEPYRLEKLNEKIGFHTLTNRLIHASLILHFDKMLDFILFVERPRKEIFDKIMWNKILKKNHEPRPIEQLLFISTEDNNPICFQISDMIDQSTVVAEKVINVCAENSIFLELDIRGAN